MKRHNDAGTDHPIKLGCKGWVSVGCLLLWFCLSVCFTLWAPVTRNECICSGRVDERMEGGGW